MSLRHALICITLTGFVSTSASAFGISSVIELIPTAQC
jgi:hypothetical protein